MCWALCYQSCYNLYLTSPFFSVNYAYAKRVKHLTVEKIRGCGYRKVGGLYLVGTGISRPCDMLSLELTPCPTCGFEVPFTRGFMWLHKDYIKHRSEQHKNCTCPPTCPLCYPTSNDQTKYGLMWVGARYYTPENFVKEAKDVGVCKRIAKIPKDLEFGKTWILLAHKKVPFSSELEPNGLRTNEPEYKPAIFYAFRPTKVEKLIWESKATKRRLNKLKKQGITPVVIPDGDKDHAPRKKKKRRKRRS
jgi:hypothetical protein